MRTAFLPFLTVAAAVVVLSSCSSAEDYYRDLLTDAESRTLHTIVASEEDPSIRAVAVERLAGRLLKTGGPDVLISFLTTLVEQHPDDPYGGLYLYLVAQTYLEEGAGALAIHYFERVVQGYPDVVSKGVSTRQGALSQLVGLAPDPERRARCYEILIEEFGDRMDQGLLYYHLAQTYEELGEWDAAFVALRQFSNHPETSVPGEPNAHRTVADRIKFYDSPKNWTVATAEDLRRIISWAIANKDSKTLLRYQSEVSFFTRSWEQDFEDPNATPMWDLGALLRNSRRVYVDPELAVDTDGDEAYLYTYNWGGLRIKTWYFYFRKVNFPSDPEIHGTWEWAGIYLGERL